VRIAMGFVDTPEGHAALEAAAAEALERDATLIIVHSMKGGERDELERLRAYDDAFEHATATLEQRGVRHEVKRYVRGSSPAEDLLQCAEDEGVDLLVIGIRRRSPVGKLILGSNAQDIILKADCPVLCVKPARAD
jgi:nucleotide-binding universal stress UspA family protein